MTEPTCNGICLTGYDIGVGPGHLIAYAHPECELHSDFDPEEPQPMPTKQEEQD